MRQLLPVRVVSGVVVAEVARGNAARLQKFLEFSEFLDDIG